MMISNLADYEAALIPDLRQFFGWSGYSGPILWIAMVLSVVAAIHALHSKRTPAAALGWIAVCLMLPFLGVILYGVLGVNRVRTRGQSMAFRWSPPTTPALFRGRVPKQLEKAAHLGRTVSGLALAPGNDVRILVNGEQAYPLMLEAIRTARDRVYLSSYIFETNASGREFIEALGIAHDRGAAVRVLVDGMGERYSRPLATRLMRRRGVTSRRFLPPRWLPPSVYLNLRNHRKILCVDGKQAFTGGMNIGDRHLVEMPDNPSPTQDLHFQMTGPCVQQLEQIFSQDWQFAGGEPLRLTEEEMEVSGSMICRCVADGPDENLDKLRTILLGLITAASKRISIMTPYFLPTPDIVSALQIAALSGIEVSVVLPERSNLRFMDWATRARMIHDLEHGIQVYLQPPPFAHSKLFVVDGEYSVIGTANLDARSLRLNYELGVEVFDRQFAQNLTTLIDRSIENSRALTMEELSNRSFLERLRDGVCWLASPYL
jgi:cardiolipin synthase